MIYYFNHEPNNILGKIFMKKICDEASTMPVRIEVRQENTEFSFFFLSLPIPCTSHSRAMYQPFSGHRHDHEQSVHSTNTQTDPQNRHPEQTPRPTHSTDTQTWVSVLWVSLGICTVHSFSTRAAWEWELICVSNIFLHLSLNKTSFSSTFINCYYNRP